MNLFDRSFLVSLLEEFRRSMKGLVPDLCEELEQRYPETAKRFRLPVELIRLIGRAMPLEQYSHWRAVGWIEALNDLVYFIDLYEQAKQEARDLDFVEQLYAECRRTWYEHSYADELFPDGAVRDGRLPGRLAQLCRRLTNDIAQQTLLWEPALTSEWMQKAGHRRWQAACDFAPNFDRAELPFTLSVGADGAVYHAPRSVREALRSAAVRADLIVTSRTIALAIEDRQFPLYTINADPPWHWRRQDPVVLRSHALGTLTLGPTLVYGRQRVPIRVCPTQPPVVSKMRLALSVLEQAWPVGDECLALLTSRIVPLKAPGVVSFSYRHQPGLSFINCFDRDDLDLIDDLIHENSHHHLNLLLRKYVLYRGDCNREIFYSPWRRTLRPIRGILHASFTFAMGAFLFERLSAWASGPAGRRRWRLAGLTEAHRERARFRGLEEIESVRYSLRDLREAQRRFGWITKPGGRLIQLLSGMLSKVKGRMKRPAMAVTRSPYRADFARHVEDLKAARQRHGPGTSRPR